MHSDRPNSEGPVQHKSSAWLCSWGYSRAHSHLQAGAACCLQAPAVPTLTALSTSFLTELEFASISLNSMDAISERDFVGKHNSITSFLHHVRSRL